jgi:hypothetical protein
MSEPVTVHFPKAGCTAIQYQHKSRGDKRDIGESGLKTWQGTIPSLPLLERRCPSRRKHGSLMTTHRPQASWYLPDIISTSSIPKSLPCSTFLTGFETAFGDKISTVNVKTMIKNSIEGDADGHARPSLQYWQVYTEIGIGIV